MDSSSKADRLVHHKIYAQVPPKVEYSITDFGQTLEPVLNELKSWAEINMLPRMQKNADRENSQASIKER